MYLSEIKLYNFRRFSSSADGNAGLTINLNKGLNIIIGENDSGKTAIIDAIRLIVGDISDDFQRIAEDDFYCNESGEYVTSFHIEGVFKDLSKKEAGIFLDWLSFDNEGNYELQLNLLVEKKKNDNNQMYIDHKLVAGEKSSAMPLNNVTRSFLKATYLKPLRNADDELTPEFRSHLPRMLMAHSTFNKDDHNKNGLVDIMKEADSKIEQFFGDDSSIKNKTEDTLSDHASLNEQLSHVLSQLYDQQDRSKSKVHLQLPEASLFKILKQLSLNPDKKNLGLGNMNLLYIATELALLNDHLTHNVYGPNIMLIEELEAHLHVQAQIRLVKYINKYMEKQQGTSVQFILTSHSVALTASVDQRALIYLNNGKAYSLAPEYTMLEDDGYEFLNRFLDATKANLFFAKGLILVEGYAENILLPALAELIDFPLHERGVSIVNVGGRSFDNYIKLFARRDSKCSIGLPVSIVRDSDIKPYTYRINDKNIDNIKPLLNEENFDKKHLGTKFPTFNKLQKSFKLEFSSGNMNLIEEKTYQLLNDDELTRCQNSKTDSLKKRYNCFNVNQEVFVSPAWTLEYSLLRSPLKDLLTRAIAETRYSNEHKREKFLEDLKSKNLIEVYEDFERNVSKAETAQHLAEKIHFLSDTDRKELRDKVLKDSYCKYLVDAIKFACEPGETNE